MIGSNLPISSLPISTSKDNCLLLPAMCSAESFISVLKDSLSLSSLTSPRPNQALPWLWEGIVLCEGSGKAEMQLQDVFLVRIVQVYACAQGLLWNTMALATGL
eukprot:scaffold198816_cov22-Tisochrysis_lutea.AAC.3